jgi:signal transduction histidine kinase
VEDSRAANLRAATEASTYTYIALRAWRDETGVVRDFVFTDVNAAAEHQSGLSRDQIIGQRLTVLFPASRTNSSLHHFINVFTAQEAVTDDVEYSGIAQPGWYRRQVVPLPDGIAIFSLSIADRVETEQALLEQERLRSALNAERNLNALQANFVRAISHDFKTPLTMLGLSLDILERYGANIPRENQLERMKMRREQISKIAGMIDDIGQMVRGATPILPFAPTWIDLGILAQQLLNELQLTLGARHHFQLHITGDLRRVWADSALMQRIMLNLLSNAIKYSPPETEIRLELERTDDSITLCVIDQGIGILPADLERIFTPFERGGNVGDIVGTGLGLQIVKDCVELHNGTIRVQSASHEGTSFTVTLPQKTLIGM